MKRIISITIVALLLAGTLYAQDATAQSATEEYPNGQIAFRLLDDYLEEAAREQKSAGGFLIAGGGLLIGAGAATAVWSFTAEPSVFPNENAMWGVRVGSLAGAGVGSVLTGIGVGLITRPDDYYTREYANLYAEQDPVVQEALAYGIIKDLAEEARRERISSGIVNLASPLIGIGISATVAAVRDDWTTFREDSLDSIVWTSGSILSGFVQLFVTKSEEERLLNSYVSVRSAYDTSTRD